MMQRLKTWMSLRLGLSYQCRCGAIVRRRCRQQHEGFHDAIREWCSPPTTEEMTAAKSAQDGEK